MDVSGTIDAILARKGSDVWSIAPDATVFDAIRMMAEKNVGALLVMRGDALLGIVSERDYTRKVILLGRSSRDTPVQEIMTTDLTTAHPGESVEECLSIMTKSRVRHLPVIDGGIVRGVVSIGDLVKKIMSRQTATIDQLENYITSGGYPG